MKLMAFVTICFLLSTGCNASPPQLSGNGLDARIARIENNLRPIFQVKGKHKPPAKINDRLDQLNIPGLSVAVAYDGKLQWAKGYGYADRNKKILVNTKTMFLAGSISKPVAALRALQLAEEGVLDLDSNVNKYLEKWKVPDNEFTAREKVTTRRILNHTAGLTVWGFPGYANGGRVPSVIEVLEGKGNTAPVRVFQQPGEEWSYSGGGYTVLQLMLTEIEDQPFPDLMKKNVLERLGMPESTFENPLPKKYHPDAAAGYRSNGNEVKGKWPVYAELAAAGLWTTPSQLVRYAIEIQHVLNNRQDGILNSKTVSEMLAPGLNGHGLGPIIKKHTFGHDGSDEGFRATLVAWKKHDFAVVLMVNSDNRKIIPEYLQAIATEYDLPGFEPSFKEEIKIAEKDLARYAGTYRIGKSKLIVRANSKGLRLQPAGGGSAWILSAEGNHRFFDASKNMTIEFQLEGETATGFKIVEPNIIATRISKSE